MVFYKYRVYKIFPINIWEDICDWFRLKRKRSLLMQWSTGQIFEYVKYDRKLECPLMPGNLSINFNNVSINEKFPFIPIVPSGRYRIEFTFTEKDKNVIIARSQAFFSISSNHVE